MILLIHLGGLGDICLSESLFYSLHGYFKDILALGYKRYLGLFENYFSAIESIESRKWAYLFTGNKGETFERIVFVGKDKKGEIKRNLKEFSLEPPIFIDMYPERGVHVEDYQLLQLKDYGIEAKKKAVKVKEAKRAILYPERVIKKKKWAPENFFWLYERLSEKDIETYLLRSEGIDYKNSLYFEDLFELKAFLDKGGIFLSNDCGVAHLAGACGLTTITLFFDQDPSIWHPRGKNISLMAEKISREDILEIVLENLSQL